MPHHTIAIIVAAGQSKRYQEALPKQYLPLGGLPVLRQTVMRFLEHPGIDMVQVVYDPQHQHLYMQAMDGLELPTPVAGGKTRQESVRLGLEAVTPYRPKKILIHDAARPFVSKNLISRVLDAVDQKRAVIPALPVEDTIKFCEGEKIIHTVRRSDLMRVQTPQGFMFDEILQAHQEAKEENCTDDAQILEHASLPVYTVEGSQLNFKITTKEDFKRAEGLLMAQTRTHTGMGYDVHQFKEGGKGFVTLCGHRIDCGLELIGHSDADVGLHALTDALLGTIGAGDIGEHFPPSDSRFKDADSSSFVRHALTLLRDRGGHVVNVDITLICETPKITPHKEAMRQHLQRLLEIPTTNINIKATTTEGLGFTGRKEGIAAHAIATVTLRDA